MFFSYAVNNDFLVMYQNTVNGLLNVGSVRRNSQSRDVKSTHSFVPPAVSTMGLML